MAFAASVHCSALLSIGHGASPGTDCGALVVVVMRISVVKGRGIQRTDSNAARSSLEKSSGSSHAAKWPPLSASWKYVRFGYPASTQLRGERQISPGNVVKPITGSETSGGAWPAAAARAWAWARSQYARAAEAPVPVSQYIVMLSR